MTNTERIEGNQIGIVSGSVVSSRFFIRDFVADIRKMLGLEVKEYTDMLAKSREIAMKRMLEQAERHGAYAVVNIRFSTSAISPQTAEILAYGTAIKRK